MPDLTHTQFLENLPSYIAGGLSDDERTRMTAHAALCAACDAALADALAADTHLRDLFAPIRPPADYEDSLIANIRHATTRPVRLAHPAWRYAGGIAAAVLLGFIGLAGSRQLSNGRGLANLHFPSVASLFDHATPRPVYSAASSVPTTRPTANANFGRAMTLYANENNASDHWGESPAAPAWRKVTSYPRQVNGEARQLTAPEGSTRTYEVRDLLTDKEVPDFGDVPDLSLLATSTGGRQPKSNSTTLGLSTTNGTVVTGGTTVQLRTDTSHGAPDNKKLYVTAGDATNLPALGTVAAPNGQSHLYSYWALTTQGKDKDAKGEPVDLYFRPPDSADVKPAEAKPEAAGVRVLTADATHDDSGKQPNVHFNFGNTGKPALTQETRLARRLTESETLAKGKKEVDVAEQTEEKTKSDAVALGDAQKPALQQAQSKTPEQFADKITDVDADLRAGRGERAEPAPVVEAAITVANADADEIKKTTAEGQTPPPPPTTTQQAQRKIIRNGALEFEVDAFDSAAMQIAKIAAEEGGYVSSTDSDKLPNGKVKGTITLRVPPDRLDTLVLKLRGLGDLKTQRIAAQDVTKQYTDLEGQLKAARTMEQRLLDIIKTGKGEVKDLVEAEKQLGVYREKIEQVEGELRYYANLVALSTLNVTLYERDIRTPTAAFEMEEIQAGVETEDVERARTEALKSIDDAKGRVIESTMKNHGFGQYEARIVAEVAPDAAGPVLDRLKQLGRVARLDVDRKQQTTGGTGAPAPAVKLERRATRFSVSLYNLANVEPRETVNVNLAALNVEEAYKSLLATASKEEADNNGGRVISRNLAGQRADQATATLVFEVKSDRADAAEAAVRAAGEVMSLSTTENPDRQNTTSVKRKFSVTIGPLAQVEPRETQTLQARAKDVPAIYNNILAFLNNPDAKRTIPVRIRTSQLNEQDLKSVTASLDFDLPRAEVQPLLTQVFNNKDAEVTTRTVIRSADAQNTLDSKVRVSLALYDATQGPAREVTKLTVQAQDVTAAANQAVGSLPQGARVLDRFQNQKDGRVIAGLLIDVPIDAAPATADALNHLGIVLDSDGPLRNPNVPEGPLARAQFQLRLTTPAPVVGANQGVSTSLRQGLAKAVEGLLISRQLLVIGVFLVVPFALVAWILYRLFRRKNRTPKTQTTPSPI